MNSLKLASLAAFALVACDEATPVDAGADTTLAVEQAPPPGTPNTMELAIDGQLEPGARLSVRLTNVTVTCAQVDLLLGFQEGTFNNAALANPLDIIPAKNMLGPATLGGNPWPAVPGAPLFGAFAGNGGTCTGSFTVPAAAAIPDGFIGYFQAIALSPRAAADTSNVVPKFNPRPDGQGIMTGLLFEAATVAPGSYDGVRLEEYDSAYTGLDVCAFTYDVVGTGLSPLAPCPGCEFAFAVTTSNFQEVSVSGDCIDLIGLDVSTLTPGQQGIGYEATYSYAGQTIEAMMIYDTTTGSWVAGANAIFDQATGTFYWLATFPAPGYGYIY